jgi:hypothetical protein
VLIARAGQASLHRQLSAFTVHNRLGSRDNLFEACSAFTHVTACPFAKSPKATLYTRGSGSFVTSAAAPIATGRSDPVAGRDSHPQTPAPLRGAL